MTTNLITVEYNLNKIGFEKPIKKVNNNKTYLRFYYNIYSPYIEYGSFKQRVLILYADYKMLASKLNKLVLDELNLNHRLAGQPKWLTANLGYYTLILKNGMWVISMDNCYRRIGNITSITHDINVKVDQDLVAKIIKCSGLV